MPRNSNRLARTIIGDYIILSVFFMDDDVTHVAVIYEGRKSIIIADR